MEIESARTGARVVRWQGRLLASRIDPMAEAELWVTQRQAAVHSKKPLVIVGLGSGYHVLAIAKRRQDVPTLVIEKRQELIDFFNREFPLEVGSVPIFLAKDLAALAQKRDVRRLLEGRFEIVVHEPSTFGMEEEFQEVIDFLTGRSSLGWTKSVDLRKDIRGRLIQDPCQIQGPLTITQATEITEFDCPRVRQAFRILSELVK